MRLPTAADLLELAFQNADNAQWVHETQTFTANGAFAQSMDNVIGASEGRQVTTFGNGGKDTLIALDAKGRMYERANARGLVDYDITNDTARYANKWMLQTRSDPGYAFNADATTLRSDFLQFVLKGHLTLGPVIGQHGHLVRTITGTLTKSAGEGTWTETIWITASGTVLPYALRQSSGDLSLVESWSDWGHGVTLLAPTTSVPYPKAASSPVQTA
jgi:hypothetical protein